MSDIPDGRAILASLPACYGPALEDVGVPLAVLPCLRVDATLGVPEGIWVA